MNCVECGGALRVTGTTHRYVASGLPNVELRGVEVRKCAECGKGEVAIPNIEGLHRCIAHMLARRASALTAAEVRFLRQFLGHSSQDFAKMLGVAAETVSRWENAQRPIPSTVDRLVRVLVMNEEPRADYSAEALAEIRPDPPKRPRILLRHRGNTWVKDKAA